MFVRNFLEAQGSWFIRLVLPHGHFDIRAHITFLVHIEIFLLMPVIRGVQIVPRISIGQVMGVADFSLQKGVALHFADGFHKGQGQGLRSLSVQQRRYEARGTLIHVGVKEAVLRGIRLLEPSIGHGWV